MYVPRWSHCRRLLLCVALLTLLSVHCDARSLPRAKRDDSEQLIDLLNELELAALAERQQIKRQGAKRESACLINAGLSQGCELSDMLMAKAQHNKFSSFTGPGRRR